MKGVREEVIEQAVFETFRSMDRIVLPIPILDVICSAGNRKIMSYQEFSASMRYPLHMVMRVCQSMDGCTFYQRSQNRYLILYNADCLRTRIRWTLAHELGHILLGHLEHPELMQTVDPEREAHLFSGLLLCNPAFCSLEDTYDTACLQHRFDISAQAAEIQARRVRGRLADDKCRMADYRVFSLYLQKDFAQRRRTIRRKRTRIGAVPAPALH